MSYPEGTGVSFPGGMAAYLPLYGVQSCVKRRVLLVLLSLFTWTQIRVRLWYLEFYYIC
jgi:hypothetical protein